MIKKILVTILFFIAEKSIAQSSFFNLNVDLFKNTVGFLEEVNYQLTLKNNSNTEYWIFNQQEIGMANVEVKDNNGKWHSLKDPISNHYVVSSNEDFPNVRVKALSKQSSKIESFNFFQKALIKRQNHYKIRFYYWANIFTATDSLNQYDKLLSYYMYNMSDLKEISIYSKEFDVYIKKYNRYDEKAIKWLSKQNFKSFFFFNKIHEHWKQEKKDEESEYNFALKTIEAVRLFQKKFPKSSFIPQSNLFLANLYSGYLQIIEGFDKEYYLKKATEIYQELQNSKNDLIRIKAKEFIDYQKK